MVKKASCFFFLFCAFVFTGRVNASESNDFLLEALSRADELRGQILHQMEKIDADIKKNDQTIQNAQRIIELCRRNSDARAKEAERVAQEALTKAREAKTKNETTRQLALQKLSIINQSLDQIKKSLNDETYTVHRSVDTYKTPARLLVVNRKKGGEIPSASPPADRNEQIPAVDCGEALKYLNQSDCYCEQPNRAPICPGQTSTKQTRKKEKTFSFYWQAEALSDAGGYFIGDGSYFGRHASYEEALEACQKEAEKAMRDAMPIRIKCTPTSVDEQVIF
jgi:hypothetical protein